LLKYEEFTSKPEEVLSNISELLGVNLSLPSEWKIKQGVNDKYYKMWNSYKTSFWTKRKARKLIEKYETSFNLYGYSLK
jgi:hypothetical protein